MTERNPYSINFGQIPDEFIRRMKSVNVILDSFLHDNPKQQVYMVSGVRGSGKTVFLTEIGHTIEKEKDWIVIDLNAEGDLITDLEARIRQNNTISSFFESAEISVNVAGISVGKRAGDLRTSASMNIEKMLGVLCKHHKKLLITIDDVSNTVQMRYFITEFQRYLRNQYPVYLLMTGLYKNISSLQDNKSITFLYRAPRIIMDSLNIGAIAENYRVNLPIKDNEALEMAKLTRGYAFAFQVLGSLTWDAKGDFHSVIPQYRQYLEEYSYEKTWTELSKTDQDIVIAMAQLGGDEPVDVAKVREVGNMSSNLFNQYRKRLLRQGIIQSPNYGFIQFTLPQFRQFVLENQ